MTAFRDCSTAREVIVAVASAIQSLALKRFIVFLFAFVARCSYQ